MGVSITGTIISALNFCDDATKSRGSVRDTTNQPKPGEYSQKRPINGRFDYWYYYFNIEFLW